MYKSSPQTFLMKYLFPALMPVGIVFGIYMVWKQGTPESIRFAKGNVVLLVWVSIFFFQLPFRLKKIETTENGLLVKSFKKALLVEYKDIYWISRFDLTNPWGVTIKYRDKNSGDNIKISYLPKQSDQRFFFKIDKMTEYIRDRVKSQNPDYSEDDQPSTIKNILLLTVLGLPFLLLSAYFTEIFDAFLK